MESYSFSSSSSSSIGGGWRLKLSVQDHAPQPRLGKCSGLTIRKRRSNGQLSVHRSGPFRSLALPFRGRGRVRLRRAS